MSVVLFTELSLQAGWEALALHNANADKPGFVTLHALAK